MMPPNSLESYFFKEPGIILPYLSARAGTFNINRTVIY